MPNVNGMNVSYVFSNVTRIASDLGEMRCMSSGRSAGDVTRFVTHVAYPLLHV